MSRPRIDDERLVQRLMALGRIDALRGGSVSRTARGKEDKAGREPPGAGRPSWVLR